LKSKVQSITSKKQKCFFRNKGLLYLIIIVSFRMTLTNEKKALVVVHNKNIFK
jgi:hypothetical protein